jgi:hypothetical protein
VERRVPQPTGDLRVSGSLRHLHQHRLSGELAPTAGPVVLPATHGGIGGGTDYRFRSCHFPTKESLYEAIVLARVEEIVGEAERLIAVRDDVTRDDAKALLGACLAGTDRARMIRIVTAGLQP